MKSLRVALSQTSPALGHIPKNFEVVEKFIEKAINHSADLVVFPELALTGYYIRDMVPKVALSSKSSKWQKFLTKSQKISILIGFVEESEDYQYYNAAAYLEDGILKHLHRKVYLPTYGMFDELRYFAAGHRLGGFDSKFGRIGIGLCEDLWHPSSAYIMAVDGCQIMLVLSASPVRGGVNQYGQSNADFWATMNRFYASAFGIYVVFVNRVGYEDGACFWGGSEVIDPFGQTVAKAQFFKEDFLVVDLDPDRLKRARIQNPILRNEDIHLTIRLLQNIVANKKEL